MDVTDIYIYIYRWFIISNKTFVSIFSCAGLVYRSSRRSQQSAVNIALRISRGDMHVTTPVFLFVL